MKAAVTAIKFFEHFANKGIRGTITTKFFSFLLKSIKPRGKMIDSNLQLVYPDSSQQWRKEIRTKLYEHLAWLITETLVLQRDHSQAFEWVKKVHNEEIINDLLDNKKGAIFLTGHFGNWELLGNWYAMNAQKHGHKLHIVFQELHDQDIWNYVKQTRESTGEIMLPKNMSVQKYARMLKEGMHLAILDDISGSGKMIVPFMGHDATNMPGPAVMAMLSGVPVIPACIYRNGPFNHEIEFFEPLKLPNKDKNLTHEERLRLVVLEFNKALEKFIRKRPEQWFWLHNRWKRRK